MPLMCQIDRFNTAVVAFKPSIFSLTIKLFESVGNDLEKLLPFIIFSLKDE